MSICYVVAVYITNCRLGALTFTVAPLSIILHIVYIPMRSAGWTLTFVTSISAFKWLMILMPHLHTAKKGTLLVFKTRCKTNNIYLCMGILSLLAYCYLYVDKYTVLHTHRTKLITHSFYKRITHRLSGFKVLTTYFILSKAIFLLVCRYFAPTTFNNKSLN